jgi:hypothetical protein
MVNRKRHPYPAGCGFLGCMWQCSRGMGTISARSPTLIPQSLPPW